MLPLMRFSPALCHNLPFNETSFYLRFAQRAVQYLCFPDETSSSCRRHLIALANVTPSFTGVVVSKVASTPSRVERDIWFMRTPSRLQRPA
jgi:hypothetical protein